MKDFRLLAIRPLEGTRDKFKKNLQSQVIYKFYQDFKFVDKSGTEVLPGNNNLEINDIHVIIPQKISSAIYSSNDLKINISAIVGQNGSGKSSLIDFYNLILYYLASKYLGTMDPTDREILNDLRFLVHFIKEYYNEISKYQPADDVFIVDITRSTKDYSEEELLDLCKELAWILENRTALFFKSFTDSNQELDFSKELWRYYLEAAEIYGIKAEGSLHKIEFVYESLNRGFAVKIKEMLETFKKEKDFNLKLQQELNFQIFYQIEEQIYAIQKIGQDVAFDDKNMFYTILLNYSLHSMNSNSLGRWVYKLFHKNDGYQTPNVINPFRTNGNIDVNSELALSTDRLVFNIIDQYRTAEQAVILQKYNFSRFIFKLKKKNYYTVSELEFDYKDKKKFLDFVSQVPPPVTFNLGPHNILDYCTGYLIKKFRKISSTYMNHFYAHDDYSNMDFPEQVEAVEKWQAAKTKEFLQTSDSHVARKFNQTYNFLANYEYWKTELGFISDWDLENEVTLTQEELKLWIEKGEQKSGKKKMAANEVLVDLFPAIFDIDIEFEKNGEIIKLSDFSSGEQQYVFNINTILYHINNLKTVHPISDTYIKKYEYVNIILDEIELYYHPEFQKKLIKDLINEIKGLDSLGGLANFNVLFLTHSPFILSDVPNQNILRLEDGMPSFREFDQTFGANIHDLLANDFFLQGFMGEFAKEHIKDLIKDIDEIDDSELFEQTYLEFIDKINLIGEPVIRNSARSFLDKKFEQVIVLTKRREELEKELSIVNKKLQ